MKKPRINLMVMTQGETDRPVRSFSLPGYFPRLLIVSGIIAAALLITTSVLALYYWSAARRLHELEQENQVLRRLAGQIGDLQRELDYHRDFTRRVAGLIGISVPDFADSAAQTRRGMVDTSFARADFSGPDTASASDTALLTDLPSDWALVTDCPPDPSNRPHGLPLKGRISRGFSVGLDNPALRHTGIDFAVREGTAVLATADGVVKFAGEDNVFGFLIVIDHDNGFDTKYGHNSVILVSSGDTVKRSDRIAFSGNTGASTAPHLHYEITENDHPVDPTDFLRR